MGKYYYFSTTGYVPTIESIKREIDVLLDELIDYRILYDLFEDNEYILLSVFTKQALRGKTKQLLSLQLNYKNVEITYHGRNGK